MKPMTAPPMFADAYRPIVVLDDSGSECQIARAALAGARIRNPVVDLESGRELLDWLACQGRYAEREPILPVAIILDLRLPVLDGLQALRQIRSDPDLHEVPVIMLTGAMSRQDIRASFACGAHSYVVKAIHLAQFAVDIARLGRYWSTVNQPPRAAA
jgi:two-component system response regulator